jgi:predicted DNA-binding ribbon-helix-helix protein
MKKKTSVSLEEKTIDTMKRIARGEERSYSSVLTMLVEASAKIAEDAAAHGKTVKQIADEIKRTGDNIRREATSEKKPS